MESESDSETNRHVGDLSTIDKGFKGIAGARSIQSTIRARPRFRLDAEMVRDNALAIGGLLNRKIGGPSVFPFQPDGIWAAPYSGDKWVPVSGNGNQHRRGLYTFWRRSSPYAAFMAFDAPSREISCDSPPRTTLPFKPWPL